MYSSVIACFEHSNLFTVNVPDHRPTQSSADRVPGIRNLSDQYFPLERPASEARNSTTSFLTATTLIYAIGAGITAAAGTRLALQLFLVKWFKLYSFQLQDS
jgi:hypothetical protein